MVRCRRKGGKEGGNIGRRGDEDSDMGGRQREGRRLE
jgi:hypothetical protein